MASRLPAICPAKDAVGGISIKDRVLMLRNTNTKEAHGKELGYLTREGVRKKLPRVRGILSET